MLCGSTISRSLGYSRSASQKGCCASPCGFFQRKANEADSVQCHVGVGAILIF